MFNGVCSLRCKRDINCVTVKETCYSVAVFARSSIKEMEHSLLNRVPWRFSNVNMCFVHTF